MKGKRERQRSAECPDEPNETRSGEAARVGPGGPAEDGSRVDGNAGREAESVDLDIGELRAELDRVNAKWLRALADLDNYRKRVCRERASWSDDAKAEVILPFLDVLDDFERAMSCEASGDPGCELPFREGVELIFRRFREILEAQGVRAIPAVGEAFDPVVHEAVAQVESDDHASNEIVEEVRPGYMLGERLLRPSRVIVAA